MAKQLEQEENIQKLKQLEIRRKINIQKQKKTITVTTTTIKITKT